ncbi:MAG: DUF5110 domain-containing protein [Tannerella sp.]|jgi:hypothetical protein|nr:DUF5110 domain-containing protein [Tannerella sp.]
MRRIITVFIFAYSVFALQAQNAATVTHAQKINPTTVEVLLSDGNRMTFDFYGDNIFRLFRDDSGRIIRDPEARPDAEILVDNPRKHISELTVETDNNAIKISTGRIEIILNKNAPLLKVLNRETDRAVIEETAPALFGDGKVTLTLKENPDEYFYGGGVQNGRFSHKGKAIAIENRNSWTDGGVASPNPFYWSTNGYGVMWYTFKKGKYDFGADEKGAVKLYHETDYLDVFFMIDDGAVALLNDFYQLTGNPAMLPKFALYQGHLNAYNRDYWAVDTAGIRFEDGKRYRESQKDNGGIRESLNGENNNYQFSARAVIDRYRNNDMPFGWLLPNDGYGAGYGQTATLDGNIANLRSLAGYAHENGVEIGLWTQSDLHPKEGVEALLLRDLVKEVRDAGVRVLKTDVAWVGAGYSFGLNGISDAAHIMNYYGGDARPFIISLDGWAGTQRYAALWTGDQTGGVWEYIRFHIPTYIGSGLSGNPNIASDMDGIFGGKNPVVNTRDFQWKTFTPMQLNMDGWGSNEKYPHALGEPAASINRMYLKLKSTLVPYSYATANEAVAGKPVVRAVFLEYPNAFTMGKATQYEFFYGPSFLVAPVYRDTKSDGNGNDIRNNIYLPEGTWIDYFTGEKYAGDRVINSFAAPLWKLPLFVKNGAIIPVANPNNNISEIDGNLRIYEMYPDGYSYFTEYDDDGKTEAYKTGEWVSTLIESDVDAKNRLSVTVHPAEGFFTGFVRDKKTEFRINVTRIPSKITAKIGKNKIKLAEAGSVEEFNATDNVIFYDKTPNLNRFATKGSDFGTVVITKNPVLSIKLASSDITADFIRLDIDGFRFEPDDSQQVKTGDLTPPPNAAIKDFNAEAYTLKPTWDAVANADYYEIEFDGMLYSTIRDTCLLFEDLDAETGYSFKIRSSNRDGYSDWAQFAATTKSNPLQFAIAGIVGESSAETQGRTLRRLFDFEETELWHTKYDVNALPFDLTMDLKTIAQLDKLHYIPRDNAGNGTVLKGSVYYSYDKANWTESGEFEWKRDNAVKIFEFAGKPTARYVKMNITDAVGGYGSAKEIYVFKAPETVSYLPGDINNDGKIDENDLTSYRNYTGLRLGDSDFEGYISNGDLNRNGLIDAYDMSVAATQLGAQLAVRPGAPAAAPAGGGFGRFEEIRGAVGLSVAKQLYNAGEIIEIKVRGTGLVSVNALSFALPYNPQEYEFVGIDGINMKEMENMTNDRLHTNGEKALYPAFVNIGNKEAIGGEGDEDLFTIKFKAKKKQRFNLKAKDGFIVDRRLNFIQLTMDN